MNDFQCKQKANKSLNDRHRQRVNQLNDTIPKKPKNKTKKTSMNVKVFHELHKNRLKYKLIKDLMVNKDCKDGKQTHVSVKQSVFTDKDFRDFALNYK
ncbi:unnamed protein product [Medioppia subpectinata]|uniref:Uncharacterized protein n=1 Tax=Medioppia subpectinata TaxID=1979941 RepID=A0A7R9LLQ8_9ACAR|nr:unnamed protein product [Medioppia subpectinata]CAG2119566.1 unnamed protein product [Medioppia subpectinata]